MARGRKYGDFLQSHPDATFESLRERLNDVSREANRVATWTLL